MVRFEDFLPAPPAMIAAVGSGGKTTCLKALACSSYCRGNTVLLTTTTHMRHEGAVTSLSSPDQIKRHLDSDPFLFAGSPAPGGKIGPLSHEILPHLPHLADIVLVEADGSKTLPMKYPAPWEPVMPEGTSHVLVLFGLSALGQPLQQVCHRWELAVNAFDWAPDMTVTPEMAAAVLKRGYLHPLQERRLPCTVLLNQADLAARDTIGRLMAALSDTDCVPVSLRDLPHNLTEKA